MVKKKLIGTRIYVKSMDITITIEDDPTKYKLYRNLKLDVFEKKKKNDTNKEGSSE